MGLPAGRAPGDDLYLSEGSDEDDAVESEGFGISLRQPTRVDTLSPPFAPCNVTDGERLQSDAAFRADSRFSKEESAPFTIREFYWQWMLAFANPDPWVVQRALDRGAMVRVAKGKSQYDPLFQPTDPGLLAEWSFRMRFRFHLAHAVRLAVCAQWTTSALNNLLMQVVAEPDTEGRIGSTVLEIGGPLVGFGQDALRLLIAHHLREILQTHEFGGGPGCMQRGSAVSFWRRN